MLEFFQVAKSHSIKRDGKSVRGFNGVIASSESRHFETGKRSRPGHENDRPMSSVRLGGAGSDAESLGHSSRWTIWLRGLPGRFG